MTKKEKKETTTTTTTTTETTNSTTHTHTHTHTHTLHNDPDRDYRANPLQVLSMGGGVQSSALLQLAIQGKLDPPELVVMADTGSERPETLTHVEERIKPACEAAGIPYETVSSPRGPLHEAYLAEGKLPVIQNRSCTGNWKVRPIRRRLREIAGLGGGHPPLVKCWIGISTDEKHRAKPSEVKWIENRYPLLELDLTRRQCHKVLTAVGWGDTIKSGCFMCMFQSQREWKMLRVEHPELFAIAREMEIAAAETHDMKGLFWSKASIAGFDFDKTLDDFFDLWEGIKAAEIEREAEGVECTGRAGCFL